MLSNGRIACARACVCALLVSGYAVAAPANPATSPPDFAASPLQAEAPPPSMPEGDGPRATSGAARYDGVGYATNDGDATGRATIAHATLPVGSIVELTALDTGRTILAEVSAQILPVAGRIATLSPTAANALGATDDRIALRIRLSAPSPQDRLAIRNGGVAARSDTPPVLLAALRTMLPPLATVAVAKPVTVAPVATIAHRATAVVPTKPEPAGPALYVQIAALADATRARALATQHGGRIVPGGGFYRVQIGPYATEKLAQQARDGIVRRGYGDARIVKAN